MKKCFVTAAAVLLLTAGCSGHSDANGDRDSATAETDSIAPGKCLNDIRFEGWTADDWLDNDYVRELRSYLNSVSSGAINADEDIEPYKDKLSEPFIIANISPHIMGGVDLTVIFPDMPDLLFNSWIYSFVDTETESVLDYDVRWFNLCEERTGMTRDDIEEIMKDQPEIKLW